MSRYKPLSARVALHEELALFILSASSPVIVNESEARSDERSLTREHAQSERIRAIMQIERSGGGD